MRFKDSKTAKKFWALIMILVVGAGVMLVTYPLFNKASAASEAIESAETSKTEAERKIQSYEAYRDNYGMYVAEDEKISVKFPQRLNSAEYTRFVQLSAREAGMSVDDVTNLAISVPTMASAGGTSAAVPGATAGAAPAPTPAAPGGTEGAGAAPAAVSSGGNLATSTVSITATGSLNELNSFVDGLTGGVRDFTLISYNLSAGDGDNLTANIEGKAYFYRTLEQPEGATK